MSPATDIAALKLLLQCVIDASPHRRQILTEIDRVIAGMQVSAEASPQPQAAEPLRIAVEAFRCGLDRPKPP